MNNLHIFIVFLCYQLIRIDTGDIDIIIKCVYNNFIAIMWLGYMEIEDTQSENTIWSA